MSSALQCLAHLPELTEYFLSKSAYHVQRSITSDSPLYVQITSTNMKSIQITHSAPEVNSHDPMARSCKISSTLPRATLSHPAISNSRSRAMRRPFRDTHNTTPKNFSRSCSTAYTRTSTGYGRSRTWRTQIGKAEVIKRWWSWHGRFGRATRSGTIRLLWIFSKGNTRARLFAQNVQRCVLTPKCAC